MFDLGDNVMVDNLRIPWLIWIQILVMFLLTLTILFSYFGLFLHHDSSSSSSSTSSKIIFSSSSPTFQQGAGNHNGRREIANTSSNRVRRVNNSSERDGSSVKDSAPSPVAERVFHPCRYFNLAKDAFLKCLGLGSGSHNCVDQEHEHED